MILQADMGLKAELRLWRLQAIVFTPTKGPLQEAIIETVARQLPNAFPESADMEVVEKLRRISCALPAPFEGEGVCLEVALSRKCNEAELNECFDDFMRSVSPALQAACPHACVLFTGAMSMSTSTTLGCEAQVGWHLADPVVQQDLGSAMMATVAWLSLRSQTLTASGHVLMFGEFVPANARPPTPKALAHAQQVAFTQEAWHELLTALTAWNRACRLGEAMPTSAPPPGPFSRL